MWECVVCCSVFQITACVLFVVSAAVLYVCLQSARQYLNSKVSVKDVTDSALGLNRNSTTCCYENFFLSDACIQKAYQSDSVRRNCFLKLLAVCCASAPSCLACVPVCMCELDYPSAHSVCVCQPLRVVSMFSGPLFHFPLVAQQCLLQKA